MGLFLHQTMYLIIMICVTDNTISVESIKTLCESEFQRHMKYHNPVKYMSDTRSFDIFSFEQKKNKILNNRKVVTCNLIPSPYGPESATSDYSYEDIDHDHYIVLHYLEIQ